jgi:hypothetical protein
VTLPADHAALDEARGALEQARSAPRVRALAAAELDRAEIALQQAQAAAEAGAPASHVDHLAYVAIQQAALAEAYADDRVAHSEIEVLRQALGPLLADEWAAAAEPDRSDATPATTLEAMPSNLILDLSDLPFDDDEPSGETARKLEEAAKRLIGAPGGTLSIEVDFGAPDPVARTGMERRVELVRAALLRRGIEASRIVVRASAPREEPVDSSALAP